MGQLGDPSSAIRCSAYAKLRELDLSARLEITAAFIGSNALERDKPLNPEFEKVVQLLGDPSYAVRQQASAKLLEIGLSARAEVTAALDRPDLETCYRAQVFFERFTTYGLGQYLLQNPGEIASLKSMQARQLIATMNPRAARDIAGQVSKAGWLRLDELVAIDKDVARELGSLKGALGLSGLTSLDKETAKELAKLSGIVEELAEFKSHCMYLTGLISADQDTLEILKSNPAIKLPEK